MGDGGVGGAGGRGGAGRTHMRWAARAEHLRGVPRATVIAAVGAMAKVVTSFLNSTTIHNGETLLRLVRSRPPGTPLVTVSNHMSTLDDPLTWGFKGFPSSDAKLARWVLAAEDICFRNHLFSYFFRLGKCIPIIRGGGIYQENMNEALEVLNSGGWLHTFPEGKVCQEHQPVRRLKWGTASLIVRASHTPIVLPIVHSGFEKVMPEKYLFGRRPIVPLCNKPIQIVIGDPIEFDLHGLKQEAITASQKTSHSFGWPKSRDGLDEFEQRWLYSKVSDQIHGVLEKLRLLGNILRKTNA